MRNNNRGASSVLIILMMVVLVVFGLAALTTSLAAMRLTEKAGEWTGEYYELEAKAEKIVFEIDKVLYEAEAEAVEYIESSAYLEETGTVFGDDIQAVISKSYNNAIPPAAAGEYLSRVLEAAFFESAVAKLHAAFPDAAIVYDSGFQRSIIEEEGFSGMTLSVTVSENNGEFPKNIDISLRLISPRYKIETTGRTSSCVRLPSPVKRFKITSWREWQDYFDYSEQMQFTDLSD